MTFWEKFGLVWSQVWDFMDTDMSFGGLTFSFSDILITSVLCGIAIKVVYEIIYDKE